MAPGRLSSLSSGHQKNGAAPFFTPPPHTQHTHMHTQHTQHTPLALWTQTIISTPPTLTNACPTLFMCCFRRDDHAAHARRRRPCQLGGACCQQHQQQQQPWTHAAAAFNGPDAGLGRRPLTGDGRTGVNDGQLHMRARRLGRSVALHRRMMGSIMCFAYIGLHQFY